MNALFTRSGSTLGRIVSYTLVFVVFNLLVSPAWSADKLKQLTIEPSGFQPSVGLGRPMPTWWDVKIASGVGLVVGEFEFRVKFEQELMAKFVTEELTLNGPEQRIRIVLPAIEGSHALNIDQLQVEIDFRGKQFSGSLAPQVLRIPFATKNIPKRAFIAVVPESRMTHRRVAHRDQIVDRLRFENLISVVGKTEENDRDYVKTTFPTIDTADLPSEPLSYCAYDMIVLLSEEFRNLRKPQLEALLAWVKAGGSLYLEPDGVLEAYHVDFLRGLVADDSKSAFVRVDEKGKLIKEVLATNTLGLVVGCGIGQAAIRTVETLGESQLSAETWRPIISRLWKARLEPVMQPAEMEPKIGPNGQVTFVQVGTADPWGISRSVLSEFQLSHTDLLERLIPEDVRMVPLPILASILVLFIVLIGPVDYFFLGRLRARKWTWITFPFAAFMVTALTVFISNRYLSAVETSRSAIIRDISQSGEVVRTNRFDLLYLTSSRNVTQEIEKSLFSPIRLDAGLGDQFTGTSVSPNGRVLMSNEYVSPQPLNVQGRLPTRFSVMQNLSKWTPQLNRLVSIPGRSIVPKVNWAEFELEMSASEQFRKHQIPEKLIESAQKYFGSNAMVAGFSGVEGWAFDRSSGWYSKRLVNHPENQWITPQYQAYVQQQAAMAQLAVANSNQTPTTVFVPNGTGGTSPVNLQILLEPSLFRWIYEASVSRNMVGIFALTRQTSPKGGAKCDDLPLLDSSDPKVWLLLIVVPQKDEFVIYRRLMQFKETTDKMILSE